MKTIYYGPWIDINKTNDNHYIYVAIRCIAIRFVIPNQKIYGHAKISK